MDGASLPHPHIVLHGPHGVLEHGYPFLDRARGGSHAFGTGPVEARMEEADSVLRDRE